MKDSEQARQDANNGKQPPKQSSSEYQSAYKDQTAKNTPKK